MGRTFCASALAVVMSISFSGVLLAQSETRPANSEAPGESAGAPAEAADGDSAEMFAKWMKMSEPAEQHAHFKRAVGKWKTQMRIWQDPDAPPSEVSGTCEFELILGGRFLQQKCAWPEFMGKTLEGLGLEGYDRYRKQYTSVWLDNMNTSVSTMTGTCSKNGLSCMYFGHMDEPMTGEVGKNVKSTYETINMNKTVFKMFDAVRLGSEWSRIMEIEYHRDPPRKQPERKRR